MCEVEAVEALLPVESQTLSLAFLAEHLGAVEPETPGTRRS